MPPPWKCCKVFFVLAVTVKRSIGQLFVHYFHNFCRLLGACQIPTGATRLDSAGGLSSPEPQICPSLEKNPTGAHAKGVHPLRSRQTTSPLLQCLSVDMRRLTKKLIYLLTYLLSSLPPPFILILTISQTPFSFIFPALPSQPIPFPSCQCQFPSSLSFLPLQKNPFPKKFSFKSLETWKDRLRVVPVTICCDYTSLTYGNDHTAPGYCNSVFTLFR